MKLEEKKYYTDIVKNGISQLCEDVIVSRNDYNIMVSCGERVTFVTCAVVKFWKKNGCLEYELSNMSKRLTN